MSTSIPGLGRATTDAPATEPADMTDATLKTTAWRFAHHRVEETNPYYERVLAEMQRRGLS